jgi:hypothetical protein
MPIPEVAGSVLPLQLDHNQDKHISPYSDHQSNTDHCKSENNTVSLIQQPAPAMGPHFPGPIFMTVNVTFWDTAIHAAQTELSWDILDTTIYLPSFFRFTIYSQVFDTYLAIVLSADLHRGNLEDVLYSGLGVTFWTPCTLYSRIRGLCIL